MLCLMHEGTPYGYLKVGNKVILPPILAGIVGAPLPEVEKGLAELEEAGVFSRDSQGCIYSRRMVRDEEIRKKRASGGHLAMKHPNVPKKKDKDKGGPQRISLEGSLGGSSASVYTQEEASSCEDASQRVIKPLMFLRSEEEKNPHSVETSLQETDASTGAGAFSSPAALVNAVDTRGAAESETVEEALTKRRGTRLPEGWRPSPDLLAWAMEETARRGVAVDLDDQVERFRDFWLSKPGAHGVKLDWDRTFRNWVRRACDMAREGSWARRRPDVFGRNLEAARRWAGRGGEGGEGRLIEGREE